MKTFIIRSIAITSVGTAIALALAIPQCPPELPACDVVYGYIGGPMWVCCKEVENPNETITCWDYFKRQTLCDNEPELPYEYGWEITSNSLFNGNCVAGQGECF